MEVSKPIVEEKREVLVNLGSTGDGGGKLLRTSKDKMRQAPKNEAASPESYKNIKGFEEVALKRFLSKTLDVCLLKL